MGAFTASEPAPEARGSRPGLKPIHVWALSLGCTIGYGAFTMPGSTFLPTAGPLGTTLALAIGAAAILVIAANYDFLCQRFPDAGGSYAFARTLFGYDHAFLCAWSLVLAYVSLIWANATAFVAVGRFLFGSVLQTGFHYQVAGYDIYLGEVAATIAVLALFALMSCGSQRTMGLLNTVLALTLVGSVIVCFVGVVAANGIDLARFRPAFAEGSPPAYEMLSIVALVPWAFLGFEGVSHVSDECDFPLRRMGRLMGGAVLSGLAIYLMMMALAVIGVPDSYASWADYVADLGSLDGFAALPTLGATSGALGRLGVAAFALAVFSALSTSLIGFFRITGKLLFAMALDGILPAWFSELNRNGIPKNALLFVAAISMAVPFVGRAAIGWATDATSISGAVVYAYTSYSTVCVARREGRRRAMTLGYAGLVISALFLLFPLVPTLWAVSALPAESYLILIGWSIVGLLFFRVVFYRDHAMRFGTSPVMWMFMLFLVLFSSSMWVRQSSDNAMTQLTEELRAYYDDEYALHDVTVSDRDRMREEAYLEAQARHMDTTLLRSSLFQMAFVAVSLGVMFSIYSLMIARQREHEARRLEAERTSAAKTSFLSNMSHDIRTPMNAIIGYAHLARREGTSEEEMRDYLAKIDASSEHLLSLINDVLEMSRIESGRIDLEPAPCDLRRLLAGTHDLFATQMREKGIDFSVDTDGVRDPYVRCDDSYLDRVLLNLVSNAYKFTPEGGTVAVTLAQRGEAPEGQAAFELTVRDSGVGMSAEFAERIFEAFEREHTSETSGIQGTGLGMSITKAVVEAMGGTIDVVTAPGQGTAFSIRVSFELASEDEVAGLEAAASPTHAQEGAADLDFTGMRALIVEDNEINREIAGLIMEDAGFVVEFAEDGQVGLAKVTASPADTYDVILMDVRMPVMDGIEATRRIRALDGARASVPIVALTANAFAEDVREELESGMDAFVAKPIDVDTLLATLAGLLKG